MTGTPARRPSLSRRRSFALLAASGAALVGVVTLLAGWTGIGLTIVRATDAGTQPCLAAYEAGAGAQVRYEVVPTRAVCVWDVDGTRQEVVVAAVPTAVTAGALALAVGGIAGTVTVLWLARTTRGTAAPRRRGTTGPLPTPGAS